LKKKSPFGIARESEISSLDGVEEPLVIEGVGALEFEPQRIGDTGGRGDHLIGRTLFVNGCSIMLEGETLEPRSLIGKKRDVMVGLHPDFFNFFLGGAAYRFGLLERGLGFGRWRRDILRCFLVFLGGGRRCVLAPHPLLVDNENQERKNYSY